MYHHPLTEEMDTERYTESGILEVQQQKYSHASYNSATQTNKLPILSPHATIFCNKHNDCSLSKCRLSIIRRQTAVHGGRRVDSFEQRSNIATPT